MELNKIHTGDSREVLSSFPDESVNCIITSPPYYGLRDYGMDGQMGLEETPEQYIAGMVELFRDARRVLANDGTLWLNIGDSYAGSGKGWNINPESKSFKKQGMQDFSKSKRGRKDDGVQRWGGGNLPALGDCKPKDLIGIPWMLAFALRADGWYLRQDIIWHKPNPMPESVTDRCTKAHEYIFLFSNSQKYHYDAAAIKTDCINPEDDRRRFEAQTWDNKNTPDDFRNGIRPRKSGNTHRKDGIERGCPADSGSNVCGSVPWEGVKANKRSVWTVNTMPYRDAHFATFPEELITDCIKAGCPANGVVLDPFMGAGTTALVAAKLNRKYVGIELNPAYVAIAEKRLQKELGMFYKM